jgi:hypothetical protein
MQGAEFLLALAAEFRDQWSDTASMSSIKDSGVTASQVQKSCESNGACYLNLELLVNYTTTLKIMWSWSSKKSSD